MTTHTTDPLRWLNLGSHPCRLTARSATDASGPARTPVHVAHQIVRVAAQDTRQRPQGLQARPGDPALQAPGVDRMEPSALGQHFLRQPRFDLQATEGAPKATPR